MTGQLVEEFASRLRPLLTADQKKIMEEILEEILPRESNTDRLPPGRGRPGPGR
jgi:hypothetical protein